MREKRLALGIYPDVSLADAPKGRDTARTLLAQEIDPGAHKKLQRAAQHERALNSFEVVAREWFAKYSQGWAATHSDKIINRLENDVFPWIGERPIAEITAPEVLRVPRTARLAIFRLSRSDQVRLAKALMSPPAPSATLKQAHERYQELVVE